jgi:hypothetical protein
MERGNTKHGAQRDDELAQETEDLVRGDPQEARSEEWREPEPVDDQRELFQADTTATPSEDEAIDLRSELARQLTRDEFPLGRHDLLAILDRNGGSPALVARVSALPGRSRYHSTHELLAALGIAHPEQDARD